MKTRRILYICRTGRGVGGEAVQFLHLFEQLDRRAIEPVVIVPREGFFPQRLRQLNILTKVIRFYRVKKPRKTDLIEAAKQACNRVGFSRVVREADLLKPDMVHGDCGDLELLKRVKLKLGRQIPIVCHVRGNEIFEADLSDVDFVDHFVSISHRLKEPLIQAGIDPVKIDVINDGVDFDRFNRTPDIRSDGAHRVGIIGRIEPRKRILECLEVAYELKKLNLSAQFVFAGRVYGRSYFRKVRETCKRLGLEDMCHFVGEQNDVPGFLSTIDVLMTLSGGSVMLEAMAMGKPIVAAALPSPPGQAIVKHGQTGFLYGYEDFKGVASGLNTLLQDGDLRRRFGNAAYDKVRETFDIGRLNEKMISLYERFF